MKEVYCNCCGKQIQMKENTQIALEDFVFIEKSWGYFSEKDAWKNKVRHDFTVGRRNYSSQYPRIDSNTPVPDVRNIKSCHAAPDSIHAGRSKAETARGCGRNHFRPGNWSADIRIWEYTGHCSL